MLEGYDSLSTLVTNKLVKIHLLSNSLCHQLPSCENPVKIGPVVPEISRNNKHMNIQTFFYYIFACRYRNFTVYRNFIRIQCKVVNLILQTVNFFIV